MKQTTLLNRINEKLIEVRKEGDKFLTEEYLAERMGVSRTPVREILKILEKDGVIERRKKGISLRVPSVKEISEMYDIRSVLEGFAGRLAAEKNKEEDLLELQDYADKYNEFKQRGNLEMVIDADTRFHDKIVKMSGYVYLQKIMHSFSILERAFHLDYIIEKKYLLPKVDDSPYSHEAIIRTLEKRDAEESERIIRMHVQYAKQEIIEMALGIKINRFREKRPVS